MQSPVAVDALRADDKLLGDALLADYVERYRSLVERLCRILLGDSGEAEDATQQTFLLAYQSLLNGTRPRNPRAWLCTIARRECWARDYRRRHERAVPREEARTEPDPAERTVLRAELATINAGLEQLPARQRQAIVLRELAGLSYTQLATALEVSESAAEALLVRARRNLREARLVLFLLPFPGSLRRLFRAGSGHASPAVGVSAAKAVAVATIFTATVAVSGSAVSVKRDVSPAPSVGVRTTPAPRSTARAPHQRAQTHRRQARPVRVQPPATKAVAAPVHIETAAPTPAAQSLAGELTSSVTAAPSSPPSPVTDQSARPSSPPAGTQRPRPTAPRPPTPRQPTPPKQVTPPPAATTPPAPTPAPAPSPSPTPADTGPATTPPPPPTETTDTTPPARDGSSGAEPSGGSDTSDDNSSGSNTSDNNSSDGDTSHGETRPGNGYGDQNHDHTGKR
jgi:RNA polymerase sigma-70 factor (ECF subfamily)